MDYHGQFGADEWLASKGVRRHGARHKGDKMQEQRVDVMHGNKDKPGTFLYVDISTDGGQADAMFCKVTVHHSWFVGVLESCRHAGLLEYHIGRTFVIVPHGWDMPTVQMLEHVPLDMDVATARPLHNILYAVGALYEDRHGAANVLKVQWREYQSQLARRD